MSTDEKSNKSTLERKLAIGALLVLVLIGTYVGLAINRFANPDHSQIRDEARAFIQTDDTPLPGRSVQEVLGRGSPGCKHCMYAKVELQADGSPAALGLLYTERVDLQGWSNISSRLLSTGAYSIEATKDGTRLGIAILDEEVSSVPLLLKPGFSKVIITTW